MRQIDKSPAKDPDLSRFQDRVREAVNPVLALPQLGGRTVSVTLQPTPDPTFINHGLGRRIQGWQVVRLKGQTTVWDEQDDESLPEKRLRLRSSAASEVEAEIYVY